MSDNLLNVGEDRVMGINDSSPQTKVSGLTNQIVAYVPAFLIPGLVNFLALAIYTRLLNAGAYGRYTLVLAVVIIAKMAAFDWLRMGLLRFFQSAQRDGRLPALLSTTIVAFVITCSLIIGTWVAVVSFVPLDGKLKPNLWFGLPLLLVWALFEQVLQINRGAIAPARYGVLSVSRAVLCLGAALWFILVLGKDESGLMLGLILGTAIPTIAELPRWGVQMNPRLVDRALAADLLRYSMPFVVIFCLDFIPSLSNRLLLQHFLGSEAVGLFAASYDLANQTVMMLFAILNMAAYPLVLQVLERTGKDAAREQLRQYSIFLFGLTLPGSVGLAFIAQPISAVVLGESFRLSAEQLMPWVALSTFVMGAKAFYFDLAFQVGLRTNLQIWAVAAAGLLNVVLNFWWIPTYGLIGAVWATCAAYTLALVISLVLGRRVFRLPFPGWDLGRIGLATVLMVVVLALISGDGWVRLSITVVLGLAAYIMAVWVMDVGDIRRRSPEIMNWLMRDIPKMNSPRIK